MESLRDVKRVMEREAEKGSSPLVFDHMEFGMQPYQYIESEEKLDEVLAYLLRIKKYKQYAERTVGNNVYMDLDIFCKKVQFKRAHSILEREDIYRRLMRYKKKLQPDYGGRICLETVQCYFTIPEDAAEQCRMLYNGQETYAFIMSNRYILGLFTFCEAARKSAAADGVEYGHIPKQEQTIVTLAGVRNVLFQSLLLDSVIMEQDKICADFHTVYCLK